MLRTKAGDPSSSVSLQACSSPDLPQPGLASLSPSLRGVAISPDLLNAVCVCVSGGGGSIQFPLFLKHSADHSHLPSLANPRSLARPPPTPQTLGSLPWAHFWHDTGLPSTLIYSLTSLPAQHSPNTHQGLGHQGPADLILFPQSHGSGMISLPVLRRRKQKLRDVKGPA